jgi:hypothetical protein
VSELKQAAWLWPLSSVGIELEQVPDSSMILKHPSLKSTYINRIMQARDKHRITDHAMQDYLYETAGEHLPIFWPNYEPIQKAIDHATN